MKYTYIITTIVSLVLFSCGKESLEGPNLNDLYGELNIESTLIIYGDSVSFADQEEVFFSAEFSKIVDWTIKITGISSQSEKIISGKSNSINKNNSLWIGDVTSLPFF